MDKYRDRTASTEERVNDLLPRMTLDEKIAQLSSIYAPPVMEGQRFSSRRAAEVMPYGIGQISAIGRSSDLAPSELAGFANDIQKFLVESTRLAIPAAVHEECLNGFRTKGATIFPQNIGLAGTWDPALIKSMTSTIRKQMRSTGIHQGLAPVLDVARDPRWGRTEETFGEDPFLVAAMGIAYVTGLQGDSPETGIAATLKHFVGHGLSEGGLNCAPAHIPPRLLRDVYLYPFRRAIREAGAMSVMNAYHELDGVPCCSSKELMTNILHDELGFDGLVVSDYYAIGQLITVHHICEDIGEAAALALEAGIDLELPKIDAFAGPLKAQVEKGRVSMALIDRAVSRVLLFKFKLGIFDNPFVDTGKPIELDAAEQRGLALEAARKSMILLKNENNVLPLKKDIGSIAVIGPNADSLRNLLGDYTYPAGAGYEISNNPVTGKPEAVYKDRDMAAGIISEPPIVSILAGIRKAAPAGVKITYVKGCDMNSQSREGFTGAVKVAREADVAVMVMGGSSGMIPEYTSGEMRDSCKLGFPGVQEELVKAVAETGTPVVLVIADGRPKALGWIADGVDAILEAWLPGEEGGTAVADVLFGNYNPGGKLPVSFPAHAGQVPAYYGHKPSGQRSSLWGDYYDCSVKPRFEFGFGLSYTTFELSDLTVSPEKATADGAIMITCKLTNTGSTAGDEVVQLYIHDVVASLTRPVKELKGFERVHVEPGESRTVEFRLPAAELAFTGKDMKPIVEPGLFKVMVGNSSEIIALEGEFEIM